MSTRALQEKVYVRPNRPARNQEQKAISALTAEAWDRVVKAGVEASTLRANSFKEIAWTLDGEGLAQQMAQVVNGKLQWDDQAPADAKGG